MISHGGTYKLLRKIATIRSFTIERWNALFVEYVSIFWIGTGIIVRSFAWGRKSTILAQNSFVAELMLGGVVDVTGRLFWSVAIENGAWDVGCVPFFVYSSFPWLYTSISRWNGGPFWMTLYMLAFVCSATESLTWQFLTTPWSANYYSFGSSGHGLLSLAYMHLNFGRTLLPWFLTVLHGALCSLDIFFRCLACLSMHSSKLFCSIQQFIKRLHIA